MAKSQEEQYEIAISRMLEIFPELREEFNQELMRWKGEFPGLHNIIGDVFDPYMVKILKESNKSNKLAKIFSFIEELVSSEHEYISNVGVATVCERIVFEGPKIYEKALLYAEKNTSKYLKKLYRFYYIKKSGDRQ